MCAHCSIDNVPKQCAELYTLYSVGIAHNGENEVGPDSRHVPLSYIILSYNILSVIKNKC